MRKVVLLALFLVAACDPKPRSRATESKPGGEVTKAAASTHLPSPPASIGLRPRTFDGAELRVFVIQDVSDAQVFLGEFRKNKGARAEAGVVGHLLSKIVGDESRFVAHYRVRSAAQLKAFLDSKKYDSLLTESQATDSLLMWEAKNVLTLSVDGPLKSGATLYKKFPVGDLKKLESLLSEHENELARLGLTSVSLNQSQSDASVAILELKGTTPAQLKESYAGSLIQRIFASAGCRDTSQPLIAIDLPD